MEARLNIDWSAPWFRPWREIGEQVQHAWASMPLHRALNGFAGGCPVEFAAHDEGAGEPYESFVFRTRRVPTRDNAHDFFNGLAWLAFPGIKSTLNEVQAAEISRDGVSKRRGPVRDAITLLDENGAFLEAPAQLREALRAHEWREAFVGLRPLWQETSLIVFGHALLEKLLAPRKDLTAHVWCGERHFTREALASKPFTPLPVLGVPGWCGGNENLSFYDDPGVFRPARKPRLNSAPRSPS